ncbi:MAG: TonB-dependent receptor [Bacteroidales bacterium]|nr:TonB-dependent receptor [Bacteroidales bacterium]
MKTTVLTIMMMLIAMVATAQVEVKGVILDSLTNAGEPFATIWITTDKDADKSVASGVTDMDGVFKVVLKEKGSFVLRSSSMGKTPLVVPFQNKGVNIDLGNLYIKDDAKKIEGVDVVANKPLVKMDIDRIEYSVKDDPDSRTNTVLEMLRKVPMVTVDGEDNISVNGSSSFQVYVNGKPNAMMSANPKETLRAMPATGIKSIAVLTNPGAKYDAEGVGGILNIVTEQNNDMNGYTASIYAMGGTLVNGGGLYAMVQQGKATIGVNAGAMVINTPETSTTGNRIETNGNRMDYVTSNDGKQNSLRGSVDFSLDINPSNVFSLTLGFNRGKQDMESNLLTTMSSAAGSYDYTTITDNKTTSKALNLSTDYMHVFGENPNHSLTLAYRINTQPRETDAKSTYTLSGMADYDKTDKNNMTEQTAQLDYSLPINEKNSLELGAKYINRHSTSTTDLLDYSHDSNITGAYASYSLRANPFGLKAGLRYEHTNQEVTYKKGLGEDFDTKYDNLVPSASLSFSLGMTQTLGLGYNMRLSRPGITYLNPYRNTQNLTSVTYGNPDLDVEKAHNLQATYSLFTQKFMLNASLKYSFMNNCIESYSFIDNDITYTTYDNVGKRKNASLNIFANWTVVKGTRLMVNSTLSYVDLESSALNYSNSGWQANYMASLQQDLPWELKLSASYFGNTGNVSLQGTSAGMSMHSLGLSRPFLDKKLNVSINAVSPFCKSMKMDSETIGHDFSTSSHTSINMRSIMASVTFQIGSLKQKNQRQKSYDSDLIDRADENANITDMLTR